MLLHSLADDAFHRLKQSLSALPLLDEGCITIVPEGNPAEIAYNTQAAEFFTEVRGDGCGGAPAGQPSPAAASVC